MDLNLRDLPRTNGSYVPEDYTAFFRHYYPYVLRLLGKRGIDPNIIEDVAMSVLEKFFAKDVLGNFDTEYVSEAGGETRIPKFATMLSSFVYAYAYHYLNRSYVQANREVSYESAPPSALLADDQFPDLLEQELHLHVVAALEADLALSRRNPVDLVALFRYMMDRYEGTKITQQELADHFGVHLKVMRKQLTRMRAVIEKTLAEL